MYSAFSGGVKMQLEWFTFVTIKTRERRSKTNVLGVLYSAFVRWLNKICYMFGNKNIYLQNTMYTFFYFTKITCTPYKECLC